MPYNTPFSGPRLSSTPPVTALLNYPHRWGGGKLFKAPEKTLFNSPLPPKTDASICPLHASVTEIWRESKKTKTKPDNLKSVVDTSQGTFYINLHKTYKWNKLQHMQPAIVSEETGQHDSLGRGHFFLSHLHLIALCLTVAAWQRVLLYACQVLSVHVVYSLLLVHRWVISVCSVA